MSPAPLTRRDAIDAITKLQMIFLSCVFASAGLGYLLKTSDHSMAYIINSASQWCEVAPFSWTQSCTNLLTPSQAIVTIPSSETGVLKTLMSPSPQPYQAVPFTYSHLATLRMDLQHSIFKLHFSSHVNTSRIEYALYKSMNQAAQLGESYQKLKVFSYACSDQ
jgi:hypothetical protein